MSGTETLVPYLRDKRGDDREPQIIVDSREASAAGKIVKGLRELGASLSIRKLQKGDYVLSDECAVERKTVKDFVYTLTRRHLFEQLFELREAYPSVLILLEGYLPVVYKFSRIRPSSVWGAMFQLVRNGITMIPTTSYKESVDFLYVAARQEQSARRRKPIIHPIKKLESVQDAQVFFLSSMPRIGRERAVAILRSYGTPENALANVHQWPKNVHGLGPKISSKAKELLTTPFGE